MSVSVATGRSGFLRGLFDLSFEQFVTVNIIRTLYVLCLAAGAAAALLIVAVALTRSLLTGLGVLIVLAPLYLLFATAIRVFLEAALVVFRIADHAAEIAEHQADIVLNTAGIGRPARSE